MKSYRVEDYAKTWWAEFRVDGMLNSVKEKVVSIKSKESGGVINPTDLGPTMVAIGLPVHTGDEVQEADMKVFCAAKNLWLTKLYEGAVETISNTPLALQATPTFSPVAGAIVVGDTVTIISSSADAIYYTTDGSVPTILSTRQSVTPLVWAGTEAIIKAIAVKSGKFTSAIGSAIYTQAVSANLSGLVLSGSPVGYSFAAGTYAYTGAVVLTAVATVTVTPTGDGVITVNGVPVTSGQASGAIALVGGTAKVITIVATETGHAPKTYTISVTRNIGVVGTPVLVPSAGAIAFTQTIEITSANANAVYYTIDGSAPSAAKTLYEAPITLSGACTVKAIGITTGWDNSAIASEAYTQTPAAAPSNVVLAVGSTAPVGGVTNVAIPLDTATDNTGKVIGWVTGSADKIKITVTNAASTASTMTINDVAYVSGTDYVIGAASTRTVILTTTRAGYKNTVRTFTIDVAAL